MRLQPADIDRQHDDTIAVTVLGHGAHLPVGDGGVSAG